MSIRVVIVDDHPLVRAGFRSILETQTDMTIVGEAGDGQEALQILESARADIVLMDIQMPRLDGISATRRLHEMFGPDLGPKILVLTTFELDEYVFDALRSGASGFLLKNVSPEDLIAAVRTIVRGDGLLAPSVTHRVIAEFIKTAGPVSAQNNHAALIVASLTERERDVLKLMVRGMSNTELAEALCLGESTVKTHVSNVLAKTACRDRVQAVIWAYEHKIVELLNEPES